MQALPLGWLSFPPPRQERSSLERPELSPILLLWGGGRAVRFPSSMSRLPSVLIQWCVGISPLAGYASYEFFLVHEYLPSCTLSKFCFVLVWFFVFLIKSSAVWSRFPESLGSTALTKFLFGYFGMLLWARNLGPLA